MRPIMGRQDPCGPHVGPMNLAIEVFILASLFLPRSPITWRTFFGHVYGGTEKIPNIYSRSDLVIGHSMAPDSRPLNVTISAVAITAPETTIPIRSKLYFVICTLDHIWYVLGLNCCVWCGSWGMSKHKFHTKYFTHTLKICGLLRSEDLRAPGFTSS